MRKFIAAVIFTYIFAASSSPLAAQTTQPIFLFSMEGKGVPTGTIHVYSVNSSTVAISEVAGSPFNAGLSPQQLVVDPTGRFVYVANEQSEDITGFSVDPVSGALTELSGTPYSIGAPPNTSAPVAAAVDPTGRFLYVFATSVVNDALEEFLYEYTIDSVTGVLTPASSSPAPWVSGPGVLAASITFDPQGNYAYVGQVASITGAPTLICSIDFSSGTLTQVGSVQPATTGEANQIAASPSGNFLYSINSPANQADAFAVGSAGAALTEISESPYTTPNNPYSIAVHPSGNFLYVVDENEFYQTSYVPSEYDGSVSAFAIDPGTGALTQVPGSPFADGINPTSIVVDPTGNFAFSTSTVYTTGYTGFAQILGFSIDSSSGVLTPLSWSPWTDSAESVAGGLAISYGPTILLNPTPMISSLSPPSTTAIDAAFTLQVNGANFVPGATVYFGGQARITTFVNSGQLNASILASDIDNDGTAVVFVFNPLPGGGASTSVEFPVAALAPAISSINPSSVAAGGGAFALFVNGSNFVTSSVVNFNGTPLGTSFDGPALITAEISNAQIAAQGSASITVTTPSNGVSGGGTSNAVTLTIGPPVTQPTVTSISPTSATAGGPAFTLTVNGSGFVLGAQVSFNLNNVSTTFVNTTQLTASIPASAIAIAGNPYVIVTNPGGFTSVQVTFTVNSRGSVTPPSLPAGSNALTLNVTGAGFTPSSVVFVNGSSRATIYMSSTLLVATLLPSDLSQSGTLIITVMNSTPGGTTRPISLIVTDYNISSLTASQSVVAGQAANFSLTLTAMKGTLGETISFSASGLPAGASASFMPSSVPAGHAGTTVMLTISTTPHSSASSMAFRQGAWPRGPFLYGLALAIGMTWFALWMRPGRMRRVTPIFLIAMLLAVAMGVVACGSVASSPGTQLNPETGTPAGNYRITVKAMSGGASIPTTVMLSVM